MLAGPELKAIHPLGKSPIITIQAPSQQTPTTIAESGAIVEYLCTHFGQHLIPPHGGEGRIGAETEEWMRYRFYMHYAEGSLMPLMVMMLLVNSKFFFCFLAVMVPPRFFIPWGRGGGNTAAHSPFHPSIDPHLPFLR